MTQTTPIASSSQFDVVLVANELLTNAIGYGRGGRVRLEVRIEGAGVTIKVSSRGAASAVPPVESWAIPDPEAQSGRGLGIVRALCEQVEVVDADGWLSVECRLGTMSP